MFESGKHSELDIKNIITKTFRATEPGSPPLLRVEGPFWLIIDMGNM